MCMVEDIDNASSEPQHGWRGAAPALSAAEGSGLHRCWANRAEMIKRARRWLLAEDEAEPTDQAAAPSLSGLLFAGIGELVQATLELAGVAALLLVVYYNVPGVRSWVSRIDHHVAPTIPDARGSHFARLHDPAPTAAASRCAPAKAPSPAPLTAPLPVSAATPLVAVTTERRVSLYTAAGQRLWSHVGADALFAPAGQAALIDCGSGGWIAVDGLSGKRLAWSSALTWVPACAQIKWSPSGQLILFEWPIDDDTDRVAVGLFSAAQGRWLAQLALDEHVACALLSAWSPDETRVAIPSSAGAVLLDARTGEVTRAAFPSRLAAALWYPDGDRLLGGGASRRGASCIGLRTYDLRSARSNATLVEASGSYLRPVAWLDHGRALVCQSSPADDTSDGACCIVDWPSGELLAALGSTRPARVDAARQCVASYCVDDGAPFGTLRTVSLRGGVATINPRPMVGIPLKWLAAYPGEDCGEAARSADWLLDYQWAPSAGAAPRGAHSGALTALAAAGAGSQSPRSASLYLLARRGVDAWCLWLWSPDSGALRPVGNAVRWRRDSRRAGLPDFELIFAPPKTASRPAGAASDNAPAADRDPLPHRPEPAPTRSIPSLQASRPAACGQARP